MARIGSWVWDPESGWLLSVPLSGSDEQGHIILLHSPLLYNKFPQHSGEQPLFYYILWFCELEIQQCLDGHVFSFLSCQPRSVAAIQLVDEVVWGSRTALLTHPGPWQGWLEGWPLLVLSPEVPACVFPSTGWNRGSQTHMVIDSYAPLLGDPGRSHSASWDLALEIPEHHFCHILLVKQITKASLVMGVELDSIGKVRRSLWYL